MSFKIDWRTDSPTITFSDNVNFTELCRASEIIVLDPGFDRMGFRIYDFKENTTLRLTQEELSTIISFDDNASIWNSNLKIAIVSENKNIINWFHEYKRTTVNTTWTIKLFNQLEEANEWCAKYSPIHV